MPASHIVLFRPGALGDALLTLPSLALLRRERPQARLTLVARRDALRLVQASGLADTVFPFDLPAWSALFAPESTPEPRLADPLVRDTLAGADAVAWLPDEEGVVARNLRALGAERVAPPPARPDPADPTHMALQLARALAALSVAVPNEVKRLRELLPPLRPDAADEARADAEWTRLGLRGAAANRDQSIVALHPGSGGAAKRWPPSSFAALAEAIASWGLRPALVAGPQDDAVCASAQAAARVALPVIRDLPLGALAALLRRCAAYVGNDSGVSHLAGLVGVPTLALFGPSDPALWAPLGPQVRVLRSPRRAIEHLSVEMVTAALRELARPDRRSDRT